MATRENTQPGKRWDGALRLFVLCFMVCGMALGQEIRKPIAQPAPVYPALARPSRLDGTVKVVFDITPDGQVQNVRVMGGHPLFVEATLAALKNWKYAPSSKITTTAREFNFHFQR
jgi:TonB family protein